MPDSFKELPYGILSIKSEQGKGAYSIACSDGSIRFLTIAEDVAFNAALENKRSSVCLMHDTTDKVAAGCFSDGSLTVYDRETSA